MEMTYENAEKELNEIVLKLEDEKLPFSETKNLYERGAELVSFCLGQLEETKGKITVIRKNLDEFIEEKLK